MLSPTSEFWQGVNQTSNEIPLSIQRDIIEAYFLGKRCDEELLLLQSEMHNVLQSEGGKNQYYTPQDYKRRDKSV